MQRVPIEDGLSPQPSPLPPADNAPPAYEEKREDAPLPAGWEARVAVNGQIFYVNHLEKRTSWSKPPPVAAVAVDIPPVAATKERQNERPSYEETKLAAEPAAAGQNFDQNFVRSWVSGARAKSMTKREQKQADDERTQATNLGVGALQAILQGPDPLSTPDRAFWRWTWPDSWGPASTSSVSVDAERIITMTALDEYPNNPMTVRSAPLRYFQSIAMVRKRVLPFKGIFGFIMYILRKAVRLVMRYVLAIVTLLSIILLVLLFCLPLTPGNAYFFPYPALRANQMVYAIFAMATLLLVASLMAVKDARRRGTCWTVAALISLVLFTLVFCLTAYMASLVHAEASGSGSGSGSGGGRSSYDSYWREVSCSCDTGSSSNSNSGGSSEPDGSYAWQCGFEHFESPGDTPCLRAADCGFCGETFHDPFIAALFFCFLGCLVAISMSLVAFCLYRYEERLEEKSYYMDVTIHGAEDYGYPLHVLLTPEQALHLQNHVYNLMRVDPKRFSQTSDKLSSSNSITVANALPRAVDAVWGVFKFCLNMVGISAP